MKKTLGLALVGGLMALGIGSGQAQTSNTVTLQSLNITLTGVSAGGTNANATSEQINNKRVISVLASALGLSSNLSKGKLQIANASDGSQAFLITTGSGKNITAVDVTPFFSHLTVLGPLTKGKTGNSIDTFTFGSSGDTNTPGTSLSFAVQGFTTGNANGSFNSTVNGPGSDNGADAVLKGTISATPPSKSVTIAISGGAITVSTNSTSTNTP